MALFHIKQPRKSGDLDNLDTFCQSQVVHNTQVPLYRDQKAIKLV